MHVDHEGEGRHPGTAPLRALIVDDYPLMTDLLTTLLEAMPRIKVVGTACDGREAVEQVAALSPDLVLLDVEMPNLTGIEALPLLKAQHAALRVILMDLHDDAASHSGALDAGADAYCDKLELQDRLPDLIDALFPEVS